MKKIMKIFLLMLILTISLTSCSIKKEEANYYKIIEMPRDVEYGILTKNSYVEYGKVYIFEEVIKEALKVQKKINSRKVFIEKIVLIDDYLYIAGEYLTPLSLETKYTVGYFNIETKEFEILDLLKSVRGITTFIKMHDYLVADYDDGCYVYDLSNDEKVLSIDVKTDCYARADYNGIVYVEENKIVVYDVKLNKYELDVELSLESYSWSSNPYIPIYGDYVYYYDGNKNHILINYKTLEVKDYDEYRKEVSENNKNHNTNEEQELNYEVYDDYIKLITKDKTYEFTIEYFRENHSIVTDVETLCSTEVFLNNAFIYNGEFFVKVGNNDSFFGMYTSGRTIPLIFRFNLEDETFSYVGTSAQIYQPVIKMIPLE